MPCSPRLPDTEVAPSPLITNKPSAFDLVTRVVTGNYFGAYSNVGQRWHTKSLQIEYTTLGVASPAKVRFQYRLEGYDTNWIQAGERRQAIYTNLDPGQYRFRVVATRTQGVWHQSNDVWDFTVRPAYYQTTWFYGVCTAAVVLLGWAAWQIRLRQIRHEFSVVFAERVRLSREIHVLT